MLSFLLASLCFLPPAPAPQQALDQRYWNQDLGTAAGDSTIAVAPLTGRPVERWRRPLGTVLSDPVIWGREIFIVTAEKGQRSLLAIDSRDGEVLAHTKLDKEIRRASLVVWGGQVGVLDREQLRCFLFRKGRFSRDWSMRLQGESRACLDGPLLYLQAPNALQAIDFRDGEPLGRVAAGLGRPAVSDHGVASVAVQTRPGSRNSDLLLWLWEPARLGEEWEPACQVVNGGEMDGDPLDLDCAVLPFAPPGADDYPRKSTPTWYLRGPNAFEAEGRQFAGLVVDLATLSMMSLLQPDPVRWGGYLYGFDEKGGFVRQDDRGNNTPLDILPTLPDGSDEVRLSRAREVLYGGGLAIDLAKEERLWRTEFDTVCPWIPIADGELLTLDPRGDLICLRAEGADLAVADPLAPSEIEARFASAALERPASPREVLLAWRRSLQQDRLALLGELMKDAAKARQVSEAYRLAEEALAAGASADQLAELLRPLAGVAQNTKSSAKKQREKLAAAEAGRREELAVAEQRAEDWCVAQGMPGVATLLHLEASELAGREPELERVRPWIPAGFPRREAEGAAADWIRWSRALAPIGARFVDPEDPLLAKERSAPWEEDFAALRTDNVLLLCLDVEPELAADALSATEATIQEYRAWLELPQGEASDPIEIRLHADPVACLAEARSMGLPGMGIAATVRDEELLLAYVPSAEEVHLEARELRDAISFEAGILVLDRRSGWRSRGSNDAPGSWVLDGLARLVEGQELDLRRPGRDLADPSLGPVDLSARLLELGELLPLELVLSVSRNERVGLHQEHRATVFPKRRLRHRLLSGYWVCLEQSAALCFFLWNRCGEDGPKQLLELCRDFHEGRSRSDFWLDFGFASLEELEAAFLSFLRVEG